MNVVESYAMRAETRDPECLVGPVLRTRSVAARDVLAHLATGGHLGYADLLRSVAVERALPQPIRDDAAHRGWLLSLARVMAAQSSDDADRTHALGIFDAVFDHSGADAFDANQQSVYAQLLVLEGKFGRADAVVPALTRLPGVVAEYLRADLASPFLRPGHGDIESWLAVLNGPVLRAGLEPIQLLAEGPTPFDRLSASPRGTVADGPLVSVIMSAYRPDEALSHAVRSILEQTWTNLELIIVDDASGAGFADKLDACADLDPRVTVLRQAVNGGTYLARNAGLDHARGEFVTFQDSDDWSHPRRVEHQVAPLLSDPEVLASRSGAVRAHDDLSHQWLGYPAQRVNASSLLFRKEPVLATIGYFDSVRKSADFEFAFRLETVFKRRIRDVKEPLAVTRLRQSSLSRADFMLGWSAPARIAYQAAYREWHRQIRGGADPYLPRVLTARPFPAPASYLKRIADAPQARQHYDVLLVDDWMPHAAPHDGALEEIATLRERGLVVGIVQAEAV
ncbi:MAG: glycosyltransferase family 2 protein, partial [Thermocrispum sp.]